jgi:hypothetical protein
MTLTELRQAIAAAADAGASYPWITGVLAGCLAEETTTTLARSAAIEALRATVTPASQKVA